MRKQMTNRAKASTQRPSPDETARFLTLGLARMDHGYDGAEVEYSKDCSDCDPQDYHRNCRITDIEISPDMAVLCRKFASHATNPILAYCLARLPSIHKLWDSGRWEATTERGYYGETLSSVHICPSVAEAIETDIAALWRGTDTERIFHILTAEYGYTAETIRLVRRFYVADVDPALLTIPDGTKLDRDHMAWLGTHLNTELPLGVALPLSNGRFATVDGRHRCTTAQNKKLASIRLIVGEK